MIESPDSGGLMATSTCIKCGGTTFESREATPRSSPFKLAFVQCASCGGVVGVMDFHNIGEMLKDFAKVLGVKIPNT
jgi:hypothetical protein